MEKKEPVRGKNRIRSVLWKIERGINRLDGINLWWIGLLLQAVVFVPYLLLGTGSVFEIHDQLDETLMTYVLNARHPGSEIFEELLGGINASGMQPSALLFIPLYRIFPTFTAFLLQYAIVFAAGFYGMYLCVRKLTKSSILSVLIAGCYSMLPIQPVYGLSVLGVPLCLYAFLCLKEESQKEESKSDFKQEKKAGAFLILLFFGLTTHLILIGYVVLTFAGLALVGYTIQNIRKRRKLFYGTKWLWAGCIFLGGVCGGQPQPVFGTAFRRQQLCKPQGRADQLRGAGVEQYQGSVFKQRTACAFPASILDPSYSGNRRLEAIFLETSGRRREKEISSFMGNLSFPCSQRCALRYL